MKTRLISSEFGTNSGISVKLKKDFRASILHGHDFYEIDLVIGGENVGRINREDVTLRRRDAFFMTPEDFHEYGDSGMLDILNIHFTSDAVSSEVLISLVNSGKRLFNIEEKSFERLEKLCLLLYELYRDGVDILILSKLLDSILLLLYRECGNTHSESVGGEEMQKAIMYIHTHFRENPSLSEVASVIPLSERYFCRRFKEYTGENYKSYLKKMKLKYARRLILSTNYSMLEIAERAGYITQSHFNREFKAEYGITPKKLRNE